MFIEVVEYKSMGGVQDKVVTMSSLCRPFGKPETYYDVDVCKDVSHSRIITVNTELITNIQRYELRYDVKTGEKIHKIELNLSCGTSLTVAESYDDFIKRANIDVTKLEQQTDNQ